MKALITSSNYVSYFFGRYHAWFLDLGYPLLDAVVHDDGEWGILQTFTQPIIPAETRWEWIVRPQRRYQLTFGTCKQMTDQIDLEKRHVWDEMERRAREDAEDFAAEDRHMVDTKTRMEDVLRQNPALMQRLARNGSKEISPLSVLKHVPRHALRKGSARGNNAASSHRPVAPGQDLSTGVGEPASGKSQLS